MAKDFASGKPETPKAKKMNGGRTGRKEKRSSLGALGSSLSEVMEDGNEDPVGTPNVDKKLGIVAGA